MSTASLYFRPWIRRGLAARATSLQPGTLASLDASFTVAGELVQKTLKLRGPGHVVGIDRALVLRSEPQPGSRGVEPNYFPFVELLTPDLPWRYSPLAPDGDKLRPWMVLVVVTDRALTTDPALPLPTIAIDDAAGELPDLSQSWAWVHAQCASNVSDAALAGNLENEPEAWLCRLLCPRRLDPNTAYIACLVPAWKDGVEAALNPTTSVPGSTEPAWTTGAVHLPVYHSFRFQTGAAGDFEALVRRLTPFEVGAQIGTTPLDLSSPGGGLPAAPPTLFVGALVSPSFTAPPRANPALVRALAERLAAADDTPDEPVVSLPFYGGLAIDGKEPAPPWTSALNLDPAVRAAAGIGAAVVRRRQESLVAACWDEAKDLALADTLVRQAALAGRVGAVCTSRLTASTDGVTLQTFGPALTRVRSGDGTLLKQLQSSATPRALVSTAMRRLARPKGTLGRALRGATAPTAVRVAQLTAEKTLTFEKLTVAKAPSGLCLATSRALTGESLVIAGQVGAVVKVSRPKPPPSAARAAGTLARSPAGTPPNARWVVDRFNTGNFVDLGALPQLTPSAALMDLAGVAAALRSALADPIALVQTRLDARLTGSASLSSAVRLGSASYVPHPPLSLADAVSALDPELLCPGVGTIPNESVCALEVWSPTLEAILVGANTELATELRWREYPTDPRATFLKSFWQAGSDDIPDVSSWTRALGKNLHAGSGASLLVFLVRGEIIRRYPDARYSLVKAAWKRAPKTNDWVVPNEREVAVPEQRLEAAFTGSLDAQTRYFAFAVDEVEARGRPTARENAPGWFLAIEQAPTGPRFGLDAPGTRTGTGTGTSGSATWNDLAWDDVNPGPHVSVAANAPLAGETRAGLTWGSDSAQMAAITLQRPARGYLHASAMLPEKP